MNPTRKRIGRKLKSFTDLSDFRNLHSGEKCFIVGAGPSVGLLDLDGIHDHVVIAINSAALLMPWRNGDSTRRFWVSNDVLCLRWNYFWTHVAKANCTKVVRTSWRKYEDKIKGLPDFRFFERRKSESHPLDVDDPGLCYTSSVPTALDFALRMNCTQIYLLGVDQKMVHGHSHFWQLWAPEKWPIRTDKNKGFRPEQKHQIKVFGENTPVFSTLGKLAEKKSAAVYNCSNISNLKVFPQISLEQALK